MTSPSPPEGNVWQLFDLTGKVALVTGATGHLGSAIARALAEAGAAIVAGSRDIERAGAAAAALPGKATHRAVALDHLDSQSIEHAWREAVALAGAIDNVVNNGNEPLAADWHTVTAEQFNRQLANATGCFLLSRLLRNHAVERGVPASVIMLGSMYGLVGSYPETYEGICPASPAAYHALKGGIIHLTRHLAVYWASDGVRVNCLSPGPFPSDKADPRLVERLCARSPMKRMGRPCELMGAVVFLASDAASYVTGHNLVVDGGWTAW
ncbi:MAG: SDR family oxidoreductase [Pirellulales bacterium]